MSRSASSSATTIDRLIATIADDPQPVYLVSGDLVVAQPLATRIANALVEHVNGGDDAIRRHARPATLGPLLADLRTFSLFGGPKIILATDTARLADPRAAAELIDQTAALLDKHPLRDDRGNADAALPRGTREAASRLLQALHVFGVRDRPLAPAADVLAALPDWALQGGPSLRKKSPRGRPAKQRQALLTQLEALLDAARAADLVGFAEDDLADLGVLVRDGLPSGHALVLAERSVADGHPLVQALDERGVHLRVGRVGATKDGDWTGLDSLVDQLATDTGAGIEPGAVRELARRTLRQRGSWKEKTVDPDTTARFAAEYRKLAALVGDGGTIRRDQVIEAVGDKGDEDVWKILDALGAGRGGEAVQRYQRLVQTADEPMAARLSFFSLLANYGRQLTAIVGLRTLFNDRTTERNYSRFKNGLAPKLTGPLPGGATNPIAGLHPYRLHRAYLAATRLPADRVARLPARLLDAEIGVRGGSSDPDAAIADLLW
ncbi:MAG: hypothetical protein AAF772_18845, partial [Acidobacteriota bacterium]